MDFFSRGKFRNGTLDHGISSLEDFEDTKPSPTWNKGLLTQEDLRIALGELQVEDQDVALEEKLINSNKSQQDSAPRLVSAMKGGREKEGGLPRKNMSVKWADDVYDPPATSMSHSVKNGYSSRQRSKPKKESQKQKQKKKKKKKPVRERQLFSDRPRAQESGSNMSLAWQEAKCSSSLLAVELEKMRYSIAEAT